VAHSALRRVHAAGDRHRHREGSGTSGVDVGWSIELVHAPGRELYVGQRTVGHAIINTGLRTSLDVSSSWGPAAFRSDILRPDGSIVRTLLDTGLVETRRHNVVWDGSRPTGAPVPDGPYWFVAARLADPQQAATVSLRSVTVDLTPPVLGSAARLVAPSTPLALTLADATSGVARGSLTTGSARGLGAVAGPSAA